MTAADGRNADAPNETLDSLTSTAQQKLKWLVERIERLNEDKAAVEADLKEVYAEAKGEGFDTKIIRLVIKRHAEDSAKRAETEALVDLYETAIWVV